MTNINKILLTVLFFFSLSISPQKALAISESNFESTYDSEVIPFLETQAKDGFFNGTDGLKLHYLEFSKNQNATSAIVIVPGRTEPAFKYAELIYDLKYLGFNFFVLDHRGQGLSDRLLSDTQKGHVLDFNNYVKDLVIFLDKVVMKTGYKNLHLISHSMGGAISSKFLAKYNGVFNSAVLIAPMLEINTDPYPEAVALNLVNFFCFMGLGDSYTIGEGPYNPLEPNKYTNSKVRLKKYRQMLEMRPEQIVAGPTNKWVKEGIMATRDIQKNAHKIQTPVLMFQAGRDKLVRPQGQNTACKKMLNCKIKRFQNAHHELYLERDDVRDILIESINDFFGAY